MESLKSQEQKGQENEDQEEVMQNDPFNPPELS